MIAALHSGRELTRADVASLLGVRLAAADRQLDGIQLPDRHARPGALRQPRRAPPGAVPGLAAAVRLPRPRRRKGLAREAGFARRGGRRPAAAPRIADQIPRLRRQAPGGAHRAALARALRPPAL